MVSYEASNEVAAWTHFHTNCFSVLLEGEGAVKGHPQVFWGLFERDLYIANVDT